MFFLKVRGGCSPGFLWSKKSPKLKSNIELRFRLMCMMQGVLRQAYFSTLQLCAMARRVVVTLPLASCLFYLFFAIYVFYSWNRNLDMSVCWIIINSKFNRIARSCKNKPSLDCILILALRSSYPTEIYFS